MEAFKLAKEIRGESFQDKIPVSSLLRKCRAMVKLLGREDQFEWIDLELNGYSERFPTFKELKDNLPPYRWAVRQFMDVRGNPILIGKKVDFLQECPLVMSIPELEGFSTTGMYIQGDEIVMMLREKFNIPALQSHVPAHRVVRAIDGVKTRIQEVADDVILELGDTTSIKDAVPGDPIHKVMVLLDRFHTVAQELEHRRDSRETLRINDEHDVQDLLRSLLKIFFDDVRPEEWTPSYAGAASRMDFLLKNEKTVLEAKFDLTDKEIGDQLLIDIGKYRGHDDCANLICFVYDPKRKVRNPRGLERDLENMSDNELTVKCVVKQF